MKTIALLTDFGTADPFVGVMKAVVLSRAPDARLVDLTHDIPPGDVAAAAFRLWQAGPWLADGTVVLAVVDPGVGTPRRAVAISTGRLSLVGPDNGIFTFLLGRETRPAAVEVPVAASASSTFHGRDVFAPAAALLCAETPLERLGPAVTDLARLPFPCLDVSARRFRGEVLVADRFGNLVTSIGSLRAADAGLLLEPWFPGPSPARLAGPAFHAVLPGGVEVPFGRTFADVPAGSPVAYLGSDGLLEVGINGGRAREILGLARGAEVSLEPSSSGR